jgi:hypothetical protein
MPSVYLETTIISYLAAWPSPDLIVAGHQQITHDWWRNERGKYDLVVSELVLREIAAGDPAAAQQRLAIVTGISPLALSPVALALAKDLVNQNAIPAAAAQDALLLAVAAVNAIDYSLTWNCRHLANATMRSSITRVCATAGFAAPVICTPEELAQPKP